MIAAALIVAATLTPAGNGLGWVCPALASNPSESGVVDVFIEAIERGYGTEAGGRKLAVEIRNNCPEYIPLVLKTIDKING